MSDETVGIGSKLAALAPHAENLGLSILIVLALWQIMDAQLDRLHQDVRAIERHVASVDMRLADLEHLKRRLDVVELAQRERP